jgi:AcrR family transcriptional regulator
MASPERIEPLQARSRATRARLLDATIECLIACGHAGTTTSEVCRRAGVSQGALFKHFPSKAALLGASVRHLFRGLIDDFRAAFAAVDPAAERVSAALDLLRQAFAEPRLLAAFDLYTAARTDAGLRAALAPVMAEHRENLRAEARRLFPEADALADFDAVVDTVMAALQGAALGGLVLSEDGAEERGLAVLERQVRRELGDV